jgi:soluble lytic murein transglycosylase-like protein
MGKYTTLAIKVPDINRSFVQGSYKYSDKSVASANTALLNKIVKDYSGFINTWGTEFEIDNSIITSFIATESGGKNAPPNKYDATGLMQVTPNTVWEVIVKWENIVKSPLSSKAKTFFNKAIPSSKNYNPNILPSSAVKSEIRRALQNNSEFSIAIGTAVLRWLLEAFKDGNVASINKVMVSYNAGYYSMRNEVKGKLTTEQLLNNKSIPLESRGYLLKMLGVNGFLDLWFKNNITIK